MPHCVTAKLLGELYPPVIEKSAGSLRDKIAQVRLQLTCAEDLFNNATDEAVLDSCIYQMKSLQVYYSFLLRQVRKEVPLAASPPCEGRMEAVPTERMMETMG